MIEFAVNPQLRLKVQREASCVTALSLSAPVPGRGLVRNELRRGSHGDEMDTLVSLLSQLQNPEFLQSLAPETSGALLDFGVLIPAGSLPDRPQLECVLTAPSSSSLSGEFLRRRARELIRREPPAIVVPPNDASPLLAGAQTLWVKYEPSEVWLPYALSADSSSVVDRVLERDGVVVDLGLDTAAALLEPSGAEQGLLPAVADLRMVHGEREHCSLAGLIPAAWRRAFADYYASMVAQGFWAFDDGQSARYFMHNEPLARRILHTQLAPIFAQIVGLELVPSYSYSCWYVEGARLDLHTDRPQCGYTASLLIDTTATHENVDQWPLGIVNPSTREVARYVQSPGDAVVFCGTRYPHFRKAQPAGRVSTYAFFHYVTSGFDGPLE